MSSATDENGYYYCCDNDWNVWLRFETWVWAALLLVQMSMVVFLLIRGRKDKTFRQAFYVFFVAVSVVDCALALLRTTSQYSDETIFGTVYDSYPTYRATFNKIVVHAVVPILAHAQPLFLTAIAVNRFTAFAYPLKHASLWRTRTVFAVTALLAATSVILGASYPVVIGIHQAVKCSRKQQHWELEIMCDYGGTWAYKQTLVPTALITITTVICCMVSFPLNVGSIVVLIVLRTTGRMQRKGPELQLFAHSLWMFVLQLFLAFQDAVFVVDNPSIIATDLSFWDLGLELTWTDIRHSSEWLAGVKATRKPFEGGMEFVPGCTADGYWDSGVRTYALPMCSVWYRLLLGQLRLREDTYFTVHMLEQCMFTLSGSVFLLIVSGNVRNGYFSFYFKWQCLSKRLERRADVRLFTRRSQRAPASSVPSAGMSLPSRH